VGLLQSDCQLQACSIQGVQNHDAKHIAVVTEPEPDLFLHPLSGVHRAGSNIRQDVSSEMLPQQYCSLEFRV